MRKRGSAGWPPRGRTFKQIKNGTKPNMNNSERIEHCRGVVEGALPPIEPHGLHTHKSATERVAMAAIVVIEEQDLELERLRSMLAQSNYQGTL